MKKREATQHSPVAAWMRYFMQKTNRNVKVEIKHTRGETSFPFSELEDHQLQDLISFNDGDPFIHKFDDAGYRVKPCDMIGVLGGYSFIAIRYNNFIAILSVNVYVQEKNTKARKSITEDRAEKIAYDIIKF
jgi:penicillin-binding protein-related factor A (putative recombinase)